MGGQRHCIESVRLSDEQVAILLEVLDQRDGGAHEELRKFKRSSYRTRKLVIHVLGESHNIEASFRVVARNLSVDGVAFIHGQMLTVGRLVLIQIPQSHGKELNVLGRVAHCRHVGGMIHEAGLKFVGSARRGVRPRQPQSANDV